MAKQSFFVKVTGILIIIIIPLYIFEMGLRITGMYSTYMEQQVPFLRRLLPIGYESAFGGNLSTWTYTYDPHQKMDYCKNEFCHSVNANSIGCNDKEWSITKKKYRIACIGDSFTEGIGATSDSTYERILESSVDSIEVMNCGISGSDPFFEYMLLQQKLLVYKPDRVFIAINASDVDEDVILHGGFERFHADSTTYMKQGPKWEEIYARSYASRFFVHRVMGLNWIFLTDAEYEKERNLSILKIDSCLDRFQALCDQNHIRCTFVFHPIGIEITRHKYEARPIMDYAISRKYDVINLYDYFLAQGVNDKNLKDYFWLTDLHNTNRGYRVFAEGLRKGL